MKKTLFVFFSIILATGFLIRQIFADDNRIDRIEIFRMNGIKTFDQFYYSDGRLTNVSSRTDWNVTQINESKHFSYLGENIESICFSNNDLFLTVYDIKEKGDSISYTESSLKYDGTYREKDYLVGKNALLPIGTRYIKYSTKFPDYKMTSYYDLKEKKYNDWLEIFPNCIKKKVNDNTYEYSLYGEIYGKAEYKDDNIYNIYTFINGDYQLFYVIKIIMENGIGNYVFRIIY